MADDPATTTQSTTIDQSPANRSLKTETNPEEASGKKDENVFDRDLIQKYPRSNRKLSVNVEKFGLSGFDSDEDQINSHTVHISPHGLEFRCSEGFNEGELLKIHVSIPDYWRRKQKFVDYGRIDNPGEFKILAKVLVSEDVAKRGKKKLVTAQTLIIDAVDEQVLKSYLKDG